MAIWDHFYSRNTVVVVVVVVVVVRVTAIYVALIGGRIDLELLSFGSRYIKETVFVSIENIVVGSILVRVSGDA
jgi:hypothetical protein